MSHRAVAGATNDLRRTPQGVEVWNQLTLGTDAVPVVVANLDPLTRECGRLEDCLNDRTAVLRRLQEDYGGARDLRL